jgi:hypothetical protein
MAMKRGTQRVENSYVQEKPISVPVAKPFDITAKFFSLKFEPIGKAFVKEPFIVMSYVNCTSPCPLIIEDSAVELVSFQHSFQCSQSRN